jgi:hypothetical protein
VVGDDMIELDAKEREFLVRLLERHALELSHEIHKAATRDFKKQLQEEEDFTRALIAKLRPTS